MVNPSNSLRVRGHSHSLLRHPVLAELAQSRLSTFPSSLLLDETAVPGVASDVLESFADARRDDLVSFSVADGLGCVVDCFAGAVELRGGREKERRSIGKAGEQRCRISLASLSHLLPLLWGHGTKVIHGRRQS